MTTVRPRPPILDDGASETFRQLTVLRKRSRRVASEVRRIREELVELMKRIESHISH